MALAVVQSHFVNIGSGAGPFTITFASPLTTGNKCYLFPMGGFFNGGLTVDWTVESTNGSGGSGPTQYLLSRTVLVTDGTTPPAFCTSTNAGFRVIGVEISGGASVESIVQNTSVSSPIPGPTTTHANDLGLLASGAGSGFGTYTPGAGWTNDQYEAGGSTSLDHIAVPISGTSLTASISNTAGGTNGHWMSVALFVNTAVTANLTGVQATAAAHGVTPSTSVSKTLTHATATAVARAVTPGHGVSISGRSATGVARSLTTRSSGSVTLAPARAITQAAPVHAVGQSFGHTHTRTWGTYR